MVMAPSLESLVSTNCIGWVFNPRHRMLYRVSPGSLRSYEIGSIRWGGGGGVVICILLHYAFYIFRKYECSLYSIEVVHFLMS